jgi:hypothetical protein
MAAASPARGLLVGDDDEAFTRDRELGAGS